jgi:cyclopropane fatty-acyl-phospholipid synthase-like methyltransferase
MIDPFPPEEFDAWAASYDRSIHSNSGFPFEGYSDVLQKIVNMAEVQPGSSVLDLGIGTGNLALLFANQGCEVWGLDFSAKMLELAQAKLPTATLGQVDIRTEWPLAFQRRFNCIVSAYTFHHFPPEEKVRLVQHLLTDHLAPGGRLVIGDIAFRNAAEEDAMRRKLGPEWEPEYYWLADEAILSFDQAGILARFTKISACAGIFHFFQVCNSRMLPSISVT